MRTLVEDHVDGQEPAQQKKVDLRPIYAREEACDDPDLSSGAKVLMVRLIDLALNPDCYRPGSSGQVLIGQMKLATLLKRSERSIRAYTKELVAKRMIWTQLVPRTNTQPMYRYLLTRWIPEKQTLPDVRGEGMMGNCRRRHSLIASDLNRDQGGKFRRFSGLVVDQYGKPILANLLENRAASGRALPLGAAKVAAASGYGLPMGAANHSRSEGICSAAPSGKILPLPAEEFCRSQPAGASDLKESESELKSPKGSRSAMGEGGSTPPEGQGGANKGPAWEAWRKNLSRQFPRELRQTKADLQKKLAAIKANPKNLDLAGAPLKPDTSEFLEYIRKEMVRLEASQTPEDRRKFAERQRESNRLLSDPKSYTDLVLTPAAMQQAELLKRKIATVTEFLEGPSV